MIEALRKLAHVIGFGSAESKPLPDEVPGGLVEPRDLVVPGHAPALPASIERALAPAPTIRPSLGHAERAASEAPRTLTMEEPVPGPAAPDLSPEYEALTRPVSAGLLATGRPLPVGEAHAVAGIAGAPLTSHGLAEHYAGCVPGAYTVAGQLCAVDPWTVRYVVSWHDSTGKEIAHLGRRLIRDHRDNSLEVHSHDVWVDPACRGLGISTRAHLRDVSLLRSLSHHPNSRVALYAGSSRVGSGPEEKLGTYTWAHFFEFADNTEVGPSSAFPYPPRCEGDDGSASSTQLMQQQFGRWLERMIKEGRVPDHDKLLGALKDAVAACRHPWELANLRVEGLQFPIQMGDGPARPCDLGKAFLTSPEAPLWHGVSFVNRDHLPESSLRYLDQSLARGRQQWEAHRGEWTAALNANPRDQVGGNRQLAEGFRSIAASARGAGERLRALECLTELEGKPDFELYRKLGAYGDDNERIFTLLSLYYQARQTHPGEVAACALESLRVNPSLPEDGNRANLRTWALSVASETGGEQAARPMFEALRSEQNPRVLNFGQDALMRMGHQGYRYALTLNEERSR